MKDSSIILRKGYGSRKLFRYFSKAISSNYKSEIIAFNMIAFENASINDINSNIIT